MYTKVVNVLSNAGVGTQDITFTADPSWTPKAAIVQWNRANSATNTWQEHASFGFGFTDGTNQRCAAYATEDNQARGDAARIQRNNALVCTLNPTGTIETVDSVATFTQWLSNGMQITWSDAPAAQFYLTVTFLGGDDISNVDVGTLATGTGTGDISVTSLAYQPEVGLFLSGGTTTENSPVVSGFLSLGAATSSSAQWVQSIYTLDNPAAMSTRQYYNHSNVVVSNTTAVDGLASFSTFTSNGFTLNISDAFPASHNIYYLVIKGGNFAVGNDTEPASLQQQTITTSKDTKAVLIFGLDTGTANSPQAGCMWTSGMGDSALAQYTAVFEDTNAATDSIVVSAYDASGYIYSNITAAATAGSTTWDDYAALLSVSSTGFVLDWANIGNARPFRYVTFGTGITTKQGTINEDAVSVGAGSATRVLNATRSISDTPTVTVGAGSVTGAKFYSRSISEDSVSVGAEDIEGEREVERTITDSPTISVSDSIAKAATYSKPISNEDPINISDSIERETDNYRSIDEDSVSLSVDEIEGTKIPSGPTAKLFTVHFVEFPEDILDTIEIEALGARVQADRTHKWNIIEKITASKTHVYNVSNAVSTTKTHKYNLSNAISTTKTHLYNIITKVTTSKTHKYNLSGQVSTTKTHLWNIIQTVSTTKTHKYNINIPTTQVSTTKTHLYNVIEKISTSKTHKYDLEGLLIKSTTHKYHILNAVSTTKTHPYNILERISISKTHKYNVISVVERTTTHKYNIVSRVTKSKTHLFSIIARISVSRTHIYRILEAIETVTKTHRYNILSQATAAKTHKYNIIGHIIRTHTHRWDSGGKVSTTKIHKYNIGLAFEVPTGAGSATVAHIKFPPRVRIVDIIADIRNLATANIELRSFDEPKIICVGVVEINEGYSTKRTEYQDKITGFKYYQTASSSKARHRIASTLIIPQILDTIENRVVSGRIAIEILPILEIPQIQARSGVLIIRSSQIYLESNTQIKQREEDVVRLSSFTELGHKTHVASMANLELQFLNNIQLKTKEIMTIQREQLLRLLIDVLKSDDVFT